MNMQDSMGTDSDAMRARMSELQRMEDAGQLDDQGRQELDTLRSKFGM